eukprot:GHVT01058813.1.p1 GENE.GHVT01058813.1~~GHVT01058813.1.p1  ORF type:complete len:500 (-),score=53.50 GHVT01058813.1:4925-6424(-)
MPIDINWLRAEKGGNPDEVRDSERRRFRDEKVANDVIETDRQWREATFEMENMKKESNAVNKEIGKRKKADPKANCEDLLKKSTEVKAELPVLEEKSGNLTRRRDSLLHRIGNLVHSSVLVSNNEDDNPVLRTWGTPNRMTIDGTPGKMHHHEVLAKLVGYETKKGVEVAGHRGYYLKGAGMMLNMALAQYGLNFLIRKGYMPVQPPFFMKREIMHKTAELKDFEETLYRIPMPPSGSSADAPKTDAAPAESAAHSEKKGQDGRDDVFLIATSEQPLCALHSDETLDPKSLPIKYAGMSTCFRKEAGSHGKDTWGVFRIHQFDKVEQFCIASPEQSWDIHEEMMRVSEEFYQSLELPYRIVSIVSGGLNDAAAKKYDLEAWFPGYGAYRELVSCSNCTDYQSRSLDIRLGHKKLGEREKKFVHLLNGTLVATQRCMCCILENYQTDKGVRVPRALIPYMAGAEFIPYPSAPEDSAGGATDSAARRAGGDKNPMVDRVKP